MIALYNTIGPRFQEICKHIPGRTEDACHRWLHKCTEEDGGRGVPFRGNASVGLFGHSC